MKIITVQNKKDEKFLRSKTAPFIFSNFSSKELAAILKNMRKLMKDHNGAGLAANQVGINASFFIAELFTKNNSAPKFFAVFNPQIEKSSEEKKLDIEGCLSIPETSGIVERRKKIIVSGFDKNGKKIKIKASNILARIFQHEIDHLNGILFTDKAKSIRHADSSSLPPSA